MDVQAKLRELMSKARGKITKRAKQQRAMHCIGKSCQYLAT